MSANARALASHDLELTDAWEKAIEKAKALLALSVKVCERHHRQAVPATGLYVF